MHKISNYYASIIILLLLLLSIILAFSWCESNSFPSTIMYPFVIF